MNFDDGLSEECIRKIIGSFRDNFTLSGKILRADQQIMLLSIAAERLSNLGTDFLNSNFDTVSESFYDRLFSDLQFIQARSCGKLEQNRFSSLCLAYLRDDKKGRATDSIKVYMGLLGAKSMIHKTSEKPFGDFIYKASLKKLESIVLDKAIKYLDLCLKNKSFYGEMNYNRDFFYGLKTVIIELAVSLALAKYFAFHRQSDPLVIEQGDLESAINLISEKSGKSAFLRNAIFNVINRQLADSSSLHAIVNALTFGKGK